jgi:inosine-uridine nucleoside N-ribohydrolase
MLLQIPEVEVVGVTTVGDLNGRRAGYVRRVLQLADREGIPVAAGADVSSGVYRTELGLPLESDYWPDPVPAYPTRLEAALDLLQKSIERGATVIAIGPLTNLSLFERRRPGILERADLYLMGGYIHGPRPGFPQFTSEDDFNIQVDVGSAAHVLASSHPTVVPLDVTVKTSLRRAYLDVLSRAGPVARLIARQAEAFARDEDTESRYGRTCPGLPDDTINFQHDPLAAAIAVGWRKGIEIDEIPLKWDIDGGWLRMRSDPEGAPTRVVTGVDGAAFNEAWLRWVTS